MTLGEVLAARAENARAREAVALGALGTVTLEALPIQDLERLERGTDADRAVFYAASRELQSVGAALLNAGKVSRPDQVMAFVSDEEAAKAAGAVRALSGAVSGSGSADGQNSHETKVRLDGVQENEVRHEPVQKAEVRLDGVRTKVTDFDKIRPLSVQLGEVCGQVSHEFLTESGEGGTFEGKTQVLRDEMAAAPQNIGISDSSGGSLQNSERGNSTGSTNVGNGRERRMHESESELGEALHENESESGAEKAEAKHEIKSENRESVHESESEIGRENAGTMHENKSERGAEGREKLHESESELTERVARGILEGLRRAAWVR